MNSTSELNVIICNSNMMQWHLPQPLQSFSIVFWPGRRLFSPVRIAIPNPIVYQIRFGLPLNVNNRDVTGKAEQTVRRSPGDTELTRTRGLTIVANPLTR